MWGRIRAYWLLFFALLRALGRRWFMRVPSGLVAFRRNYDADRLPPVTPEERNRINDFGRCIACGLCDRGESERIAASAGAYRGLMTLVLAGSRSMPDFTAAAAQFQYVPDEVLEEKERICPTAVPFRELAQFVRAKASEVRASLPAPANEGAETERRV